ncbi:unnamed protein product [Leuciscus chuanchicus]
MEVSHSIRERTIAENSLVILLQGLHGQVTTVDLRDESTARGRVINVDAFMNIRLEKVLYRDRRGRMSSMDDLFVTGRNVRYVHIPDHMNIRETIESQLAKIHRRAEVTPPLDTGLIFPPPGHSGQKLWFVRKESDTSWIHPSFPGKSPTQTPSSM